MKKLILLLAVVIGCMSCSKEAPRELTAGQWRAVLKLGKEGVEMPFNFEVVKNQDATVVYLVNGQERLLLPELRYEGDSVKIQMHIFEAEIVAKLEPHSLSGVYRKAGGKTVLPFSAEHNLSYRFSDKPQPAAFNASGSWSTWFVGQEGDSTQAVGIFQQQDNKLEGTFLTTTGDYRFLAGNVDGNQLNLSCFDGTHAFLFKATMDKEGRLQGEFWSGSSGYERWTAWKDDQAALPDPEKLTFLKPGYEKLEFSFPDVNGKKVSLSDPKFKDKVVVVQLLGSWCPNCMDETAFLAPYYSKNKDKGLEIIGLAYERSPEFDKAAERVNKMKARFSIGYDVLIAGVADKKVASETLPMINQVMAFPTTIIIDKKGRVRKIHTGFSGPGTGSYYTKFTEDFNLFIEKLLAEQV